MTTLKELEAKVEVIRKTLNFEKSKWSKLKRELDRAEDKVILTKEALYKAEDELRVFKDTKVLTTVDEDLRKADIEGFTKRMPAAMQKIDAQDKARLEKETQSELVAFKEKIKERKANANVDARDEDPVS